MSEGQWVCDKCGHEARRHYPIGGCAEGTPRCGCSGGRFRDPMTDDARTARLRRGVRDALETCRTRHGHLSSHRFGIGCTDVEKALDAYDSYAAEMRREGALTTLRKLEPECWCASGLHQCAIHHLLSEAERGEAT